MSEKRTHPEIDRLLIKLLENYISDSEIHQLDESFADQPELVDYYCDFVINYAAVRMKLNDEVEAADETSDGGDFDAGVWSELAEYERKAYRIDIPQDKPEPPTAAPVEPRKSSYKPSRLSRYIIASYAAVILFLILFNRFSPVLSGKEVATLQDTLDARWGQSRVQMHTGIRLKDSDPPYVLEAGYAKIAFDNQVKVVVEAPAEFQLIADDQLMLNYGRVYAVVPDKAYGFIVNTPDSRVIDLGTEFGLERGRFDNNTELHVIKGKINLISGIHAHKINMDVSEGDARLIEGATGEVRTIDCNDRIFVREIESATGLAWRGEPVDITSLVAGGDGFNPVYEFRTLNPNSGRYTQDVLKSKFLTTNGRYNPVENNPYLDGVFVPAGNEEPITITSQGHTILCPGISGAYTHNIAPFFRQFEQSQAQPPLFNGMYYGTAERPAILVHSNIGFTLDLQTLRETYPDLTIRGLETGYGLTWAEKRGQADFQILVDGELKFEQKKIRSRRNHAVAKVDLEAADRFLTFVVTDSPTSDMQTAEKKCFCDFFYLLEPRLIVQ